MTCHELKIREKLALSPIEQAGMLRQRLENIALLAGTFKSLSCHAILQSALCEIEELARELPC